jgi:cytochrome c
MQWVKHKVTIERKGEKNPVSATTENIESGKHIFAYYCVVCHGRERHLPPATARLQRWRI